MAAPATSELYSSYQTYLMHGTGSGTLSYTKIVDINSAPQMGGAPESIDMTSLSNAMKVSIPGIQQTDDLTFEANYNPTVFNTIKTTYCDGKVHHWALYLGATSAGVPDGSAGIFTWDGIASIYYNATGVNEGRKMSITINPTTDIDFTAPT